MKKPKKLLTRRKQAWANNFKPDVLVGQVLSPNAGTEAKYYARLAREVEAMCEKVEARLKRFFNTDTASEYFAMDDSIASQARILTNRMLEEINKQFEDMAKPAAEAMASSADAASSATVHTSLKQLSGGLSLPTAPITPEMKQILSATITENVNLIKTISGQYLDGVQQAVMRSITTGNGMQDLVPYLEKHKGITIRRARMIARDQTKKAYSNLSRARMQNLGVKKFRWLHSGGGHTPRKLHQSYSGKIFSFDDLPILDEGRPERGIPGQAINCGCKMIPVLEFGEE